MDELDESTRIFRLVDDVFFVVKKCLRCAFFLLVVSIPN